MRLSHPLAPLLLTLPLFAFAAGCAPVTEGEAVAASEDLTVIRGDFRTRYLLTGELRASRSHPLVVPRSGNGRLQIRWMEDDGAEVAAGQRVVEFDNSSFETDLEEKRLRVAEAESGLDRARATARTTEAEKRFAVEQKRAELEKARIEAAVPEDVLARREYQERQMALEKAEVELEKALSDLEAALSAQANEVAIQEVELAKARRDLATAEEALSTLSLTAPVSGVLVVEDHPWESRKIQVGDTLWMGYSVMHIPDLTSLEVEAELSDVDEGRVRSGMEAWVTPDAFQQMRLPGRVIEVTPVAREVERSSTLRSFAVRVAVDGIDPRRLRPGMSAKVEVLGEPLEALLVPRASLDLAAGQPRVRLSGGGWEAVELGPCNPTHCVVEAGLEPGQRLAHAAGPAIVEGG